MIKLQSSKTGPRPSMREGDRTSSFAGELTGVRLRRRVYTSARPLDAWAEGGGATAATAELLEPVRDLVREARRHRREDAA